MITRRLQSIVTKDLAKKMVMVAGPRQCGKTTFSKALAKDYKGSWRYYSWDIDQDRKMILAGRLEAGRRLWILDEIHKYRRWRNFLKGLYDAHYENHHMLVTGSAKLNVYSRGGDSLQGRYFFHRLHPFTLPELLGIKNNVSWEERLLCEKKIPLSAKTILNDLLLLSGFPEPFLSGSDREARRWRLAYGSRLIAEEVRTLERVDDLGQMEVLMDHLPATVGSLLSINSLREDLQVAFETARRWVMILENLYSVFRVAPFGAPRIRALKKEQKLYCWDWARVPKESHRLENLVALHLLRLVHYLQDVEGEAMELRYFRDLQGHEVDFILLKDRKPWCAVEVKTSQQSLDPSFKYLLERVKIPYAFQIHLHGEGDWEPPSINGSRIRILPAHRFLGQWV